MTQPPYPPHGQYPGQPSPQWNPAGYPPPQQYPYPPAGKKPKKKWPWIVGGAVLLLLVIGVAGGGSKNSPSSAASSSGTGSSVATATQAASSGSTVVYEVTGRGKATNITYTKEGFQMEQASNAALPFTKQLTFKDEVTSWSGLSVVAQNGGSSGDITCRILVDGREVAKSTSSGAYSVVTCNGTNV